VRNLFIVASFAVSQPVVDRYIHHLLADGQILPRNAVRFSFSILSVAYDAVEARAEGLVVRLVTGSCRKSDCKTCDAHGLTHGWKNSFFLHLNGCNFVNKICCYQHTLPACHPSFHRNNRYGRFHDVLIIFLLIMVILIRMVTPIIMMAVMVAVILVALFVSTVGIVGMITVAITALIATVSGGMRLTSGGLVRV